MNSTVTGKHRFFSVVMLVGTALTIYGCDDSDDISNSGPETKIEFPTVGHEVALPFEANGSATDVKGVEFVWLAIKDIETDYWWTGSEWSTEYFRYQVDVLPKGGAK